MALTGLLLLTSDTRLANGLADPPNEVPRVYLATVRGEVTEKTRLALESGVDSDGDHLAARSPSISKAAKRETHLPVTLTEGKNPEIRHLFKA